MTDEEVPINDDQVLRLATDVIRAADRVRRAEEMLADADRALVVAEDTVSRRRSQVQEARRLYQTLRSRIQPAAEVRLQDVDWTPPVNEIRPPEERAVRVPSDEELLLLSTRGAEVGGAVRGAFVCCRCSRRFIDGAQPAGRWIREDGIVRTVCGDCFASRDGDLS